MNQSFNASQSLDEAQTQLSELCRLEYGLDLPELLQGITQKDALSILRYNRLLGLILKRPFAEAGKPIINGKTGALHSWKWVPDKLAMPEFQSEWQYAVLSELCNEYNESQEIPPAEDLKQFVIFVGGEGRLSMRLLKSTAKYLCGDPKVRETIDEVIKIANDTGVRLVNPNPTVLISNIGLAVCGIIANAIPYGVLLGPIAGGLSILVLAIGLDAFCTWAREESSSLEDEEYKEQHVPRT